MKSCGQPGRIRSARPGDVLVALLLWGGEPEAGSDRDSGSPGDSCAAKTLQESENAFRVLGVLILLLAVCDLLAPFADDTPFPVGGLIRNAVKVKPRARYCA